MTTASQGCGAQSWKQIAASHQGRPSAFSGDKEICQIVRVRCSLPTYEKRRITSWERSARLLLHPAVLAASVSFLKSQAAQRSRCEFSIEHVR